MVRSFARISLFMFACSLSACEGPDPAFGRCASRLIYNQDNRVDLYEHPDEAVRALGRESIVALVPAERLEILPDDSVRLHPQSLVSDFGVCPDERFAEQPSLSVCSGVLIGPDHVITAGHCLSGNSPGDRESFCKKRLRFVFGFYYEGLEKLAILESRDVYQCASVVSYVRDASDATHRLDYAIVKLDRVVTPDRVPVSVQLKPVKENAALYTLGFGQGLPMKVDDGGVVIDSRNERGDYFYASTDTFGGSSGAGVFTEDLKLVGIFSRGGVDYEEDEGCLRARHLSTEEIDGRAEAITYLGCALQTCSQREEDWPPPESETELETPNTSDTNAVEEGCSF